MRKNNKQETLILFGAGSYGQKALKELTKNFEILFFIDNNPSIKDTYVGQVPVRLPEYIENNTVIYDKIVITSQFYKEILEQLQTSGIPRNKIRIYNVDFPHSSYPEPILDEPTIAGYSDIMQLLVGKELATFSHWDNNPAEKAVFCTLLQNIKPRCAIEIGSYKGGSLRVIHHYSEKVYSLDIDPECKLNLSEELPKAEFITGPSQKTLPILLNKIKKDSEHLPVNFIFVDGDHSQDGVYKDLQAILTYQPEEEMILLLHDSANPGCRKGMLKASWEDNPYVHFVDLDFVPGILHYNTLCYREMWGGYALALLKPVKRSHTLIIQQKSGQQLDALYYGSNHVYKDENPFKKSFMPFSNGSKDNIIFSACLPNYNHSDVIETAINAMLSQSRPPDELLICDDASNDNSWEKLKELQKKHPCIRLIKNSKNLGVVKTLSRLLNEAKGHYVYFGGADDQVMPLFFENVLHLLEKYPGANLGMASFYSTNTENEIIYHNKVTRWKKPGYYSSDNCLHNYFMAEVPNHSLSSATIYKKQALINAGGFRTKLGHWTDSFVIRVLCLQSGCVYTPHPGAKFLSKDDSFSGRQNRKLETSLEIINLVYNLMQSSDYRSLFPEKYINWWKDEYKKIALQLSEKP